MPMSNVTEEQAKKKYAEAGLARIKPIVPELPTTIEDPTKKTGAAWLSDYVNSLKKPITPEEEARRERAARAVQGVAGLGNVMTAFSNLAFTGKGAPSQTLPTQQTDAMGKGITSWQDKLASEREKYAAAMLGAKTQQWKMEQEMERARQAQANADRAHNESVRQFNERMAKDEERWKKQNQQSQEQQRIANEQWEKTHRLALQREERLNQEDSKKNKPVPFLLGDNEWVEVPRDKWTKSEIASVYAKIPEDVRKKIETVTSESSGYDGKSTTREIKPTPEQMEQYIGQYKHLPEVANALRKLAGLKPVEPKPEDVPSEIVYTPKGKVPVNPENPYIVGDSEIIDYVPKNK